MGQRVSANLFRLKSLRTWNSHWFAKSEYTYLLSLDYKIRDFIDFIFYNLKWPTSELQIKRFLSRSVVLELFVTIPNDQLMFFLEFTKFFGNINIINNIDIFKFNSLMFEFNYVLSNFSSDILNKSIFLLLLRNYKLDNNYFRSSISYFYRNLFNISSVSFLTNLNGRLFNKLFRTCLYIFDREKTFFKSPLLNKFSKNISKKFHLFKFLNSKYYIVDLLSLFSRTKDYKLYLTKYNVYLRILSYIVRLRGSHQKTMELYPRLLSAYKKRNYSKLYGDAKGTYDTYFQNIRKGLMFLLYEYYNKNPYVLFSNYFITRRPIDLYIQFSKSNNGYISKKRMLQSTKYSYNYIEKKINYFKHYPFNKDILTKSFFNIRKDFLRLILLYLLYKFSNRFGHIRRKNIVLNSLKKNKFKFISTLYGIIDHFPISFLSKWLISVLNKKKNSSDYHSKVYRSSLNRRWHPFVERVKDQKINLFSTLKQHNYLYKKFKKEEKFKKRYLNKHINKRYFQKLKYNKVYKSDKYYNIIRYLKNKSVFNLNYRNFKLLFSSVLLNNLHFFSGKNDYINYFKKYRYNRKFRYSFRMDKQINLVRRIQNAYFKQLKSKKKFKRNELKKSNFEKNVADKSIFLHNNRLKSINILTRCSKKNIRMFFFFNSFWYCNSGSFFLNKLVHLIKYSNFNLKTKFYDVYKNIYSIFIYKKFINIFNYLRFENSIFTCIKFLRFFKKFFLEIKKNFLKKRSENIIFYILFSYFYLNTRFLKMQLFIRNMLNLFLRNDFMITQSIQTYSIINIYIFIYYFYSHLKFIQLIIRILQLCLIIPYKIILNQKLNIYSYMTKSTKHDSNKMYVFISRMYYIHTAFMVGLQKYLPTMSSVNLRYLNLNANTMYGSLIKLIPSFIRHPYYIVDHANALYDTDEINGFKIPLLQKPFSMNNTNIINVSHTNNIHAIYSKQWEYLMHRRWPYFFRYVADKITFYLDDIYRDLIPTQSLELFSNIIEYNLSLFTNNIVKFMPIFYINKKIPFYQSKLVCLYVTYELEKGMPYFLVLKQIVFNNRSHQKHKKKYTIKNLNNIIDQRISTIDYKLMQFNKLEFIKKYRNEWQSKSIFKYYILRSFYSFNLVRGFRCKLGIRISCSGRMYRRQTRSHTMWFVDGALPLRSFEKYIDYYSSSAVTRLGTVGVKVWIYLSQSVILK